MILGASIVLLLIIVLKSIKDKSLNDHTVSRTQEYLQAEASTGTGTIGALAEASKTEYTGNPEELSGRILNIGSVSKMFATAAVMQLVDQDKVYLDAPVTAYIPEFTLADERYKKITVRMLMNHTSGLMGTIYGKGFCFDEVNSDYHDEFLTLLAKQQLKYEPGAFNCYCNDGFTLLEILVERVSGMTFTEYLEENICRPLALTSTGTMWNIGSGTGNGEMGPDSMSAAKEHEYVHLLGAGGIMSTAADLCGFGSAFFTGNDILLSEQSKTEMAENYKTGCPEDFGLGWDNVRKEDYEKAGVTVLVKDGDTFYHSASLAVAPDEKITAAVISSGGGSSVNEEIVLALLDIALAEQGISVEHPDKAIPETIDTVPEKYLSYEGLYADSQRTVNITFPDGRYMQIASVTSDQKFEFQYMYSNDGQFVKMSGDAASGKAIPAKPAEILRFEEREGQVYLADTQAGCTLYKVSEKETDENAQRAWDQRNDVSYFMVSGPASDCFYAIENCRIKLHTDERAPGHVNGWIMLDEKNLGYETIVPGSGSRDLSTARIEESGGKEYLILNETNCRYISGKCIPALPEDLTRVDLETDEARWFMIDGAENVTLRLDIPEKASVYVYDQYGNVRYSSFMTEYGNEVPLPEYGYIVFIGETGSSIKAGIIR